MSLLFSAKIGIFCQITKYFYQCFVESESKDFDVRENSKFFWFSSRLFVIL